MKTTMKQYSFASQLKSLAVVFGIALTFASCAKEDVAQNPTNKEGDNDKNLTTFVAGDEAKTRTSLDYNSSDFSWEAGDYIYVKDDDGVLQKSSNAPTQKVASFRYRVPGKFGASASYKVYYLGKNSNGSQVTISANQTQTAPDNTEHFGTAGDYGTATATGAVGGSIFSFQLEHQPAYLVFQPYTSNTILQNCYLTKVEVTSDNDIAETYTVNTSTGALTGSAGSKQIVLTTSGSSSNPNGFPLSNSSASVSTNGAYMVIKPGTHILKVRYWVKDVATNVEGTITKALPATAYASNTYYDMTANLNVRDYDGARYYMWDAQQNYWSGHEWNSAAPWQPVLNGQSNSNYAQSNTDPRYYNEAFTYGADNKATHTPCKDLPNVNEMTWYAAKGDPRWDGDELWTTMGHLYKGGMWFKKKANISGYSPNTAYDGSDWRTNGGVKSWSVSQTLPSAADANNYFYLPALGFYSYGQLYHVGNTGYYWSSSADSHHSSYAYDLHFGSGGVTVNSSRYRIHGFRVGGFE
jgi:putative lipoprotein